AARLDQEVSGVVADLAGQGRSLKDAAQVLAEAAGDTRQLAGVVMETSSRSASNIEAAAAAAEELTVSIAEIGRNVGRSTTLAERGAAEA
ncbi:hypothetical protein ACSTI7_23705, partial [Vibrio parahaemolyticus]